MLCGYSTTVGVGIVYTLLLQGNSTLFLSLYTLPKCISNVHHGAFMKVRGGPP